jgi:hypothetical protein
VFCPCWSALVGPDHHSEKKCIDFDHEIMENLKKVLILTMKLWKMVGKKSHHSSNSGQNPAIWGKMFACVCYVHTTVCTDHTCSVPMFDIVLSFFGHEQ